MRNDPVLELGLVNRLLEADDDEAFLEQVLDWARSIDSSNPVVS